MPEHEYLHLTDKSYLGLALSINVLSLPLHIATWNVISAKDQIWS